MNWIDYSYADTRGLYTIIESGENITPDEKKRQKDAVNEVVSYCQNNTDCRRVQVLKHFGQAFSASECHKHCDVCVAGGDVVKEDVSAIAIDALKLVRSVSADAMVTKAACMDVFRGANTADLKRKGLNNNSFHGIGKSIPRDKIDRLFVTLLDMDALESFTANNRAGFSNQYIRVRVLPISTFLFDY
jgi:superfamily II DNA helicase RecQ